MLTILVCLRPTCFRQLLQILVKFCFDLILYCGKFVMLVALFCSYYIAQHKKIKDCTCTEWLRTVLTATPVNPRSRVIYKPMLVTGSVVFGGIRRT